MEGSGIRVVVTGGAGFIGTNLVKTLLEKGFNVYSIDNYSTGKWENHQKGCTYVESDIKEERFYSSLDHITPDIIIHLAAQARIQPSFDKPKEYFKTNGIGTLNVAAYCAENDIPLIYAGSSSHHSGKFKNPYTFTKDLGEEILELYQTHFGLRSNIIRFYNVYGPYQLTEGAYTTLIGKWLNQIKKGEQCEIYGDGEQRRDFTHVDDIVDAILKAIRKEAYGFIFELGRGENHSVNEVAKMMGITPSYQPAKQGEANITLSTDRTAYDILGWEPKINLNDYLNENIK